MNADLIPNAIVEVGTTRFGNRLPLTLIAGPCALESRAHALEMAQALKEIAARLKIGLVYKTSFDKANRTSSKSARGIGLDQALPIFADIRDSLGLAVLTDVHEIEQCARAAQAVDVLQIPAFLCRQTDLIVAAARSGRAVNIKKGQFVSPWDMRHAVDKARQSGGERVFVTERGSSFGYNNLVVDMRSLAIMRGFAPVVFDGTHSVQLPSAAASADAAQSGGQPEFIPLLTRAAAAAGVDGIFLEVHDNPAQARSDGANALDLKDLRGLLRQIMAVHAAASAQADPA
jgi:2-dehydro-3-deoxyphosphooctonate aldolase (KDO 8-P synthase)